MNIIFNIDSKQEILLGCTKIEITESRRPNGFFRFIFTIMGLIYRSH